MKRNICGDNMLIAKFMGGYFKTKMVNKEVVTFFALPNGFYVESPLNLNYHKSWDLLMPVIEQCFIFGNQSDSNLIENITHELLECDIRSTYDAVVKFITFYNQNLKT